MAAQADKSRLRYAMSKLRGCTGRYLDGMQPLGEPRMSDKDKLTVGAAPDVPVASNSRLRDARLTRALHHMPDARMQPSAQARLAVQQHAQQAVAGRFGSATPKAGRWWQRLLGAPGASR